MHFIRACFFNLFYYGGMALFCIAFIPFLIAPRSWLAAVLNLFFKHYGPWVERHILGLDYQIRGIENLPKNGPYLVAMKHQSAYETMKLPVLFNDPAVILKRELMWIPIWGWLAARMNMIAINRSKGKSAINVMIGNAQKPIEQKRPIVIFPQGTRVAVGAKKPYKFGIMKLYETYDLPIIPVALNSGLFWPRKSFIKKSGTVIFEILPAIPAGQNSETVFKKMEQDLEQASERLATP